MFSTTASSLTLSDGWAESGNDEGWDWSRQQFKLPLSCAGSSKLLSRVGDFLNWSGEKPLGSVALCLAAYLTGKGGPTGGEQLTGGMLSNGCE